MKSNTILFIFIQFALIVSNCSTVLSLKNQNFLERKFRKRGGPTDEKTLPQNENTSSFPSTHRKRERKPLTVSSKEDRKPLTVSSTHKSPHVDPQRKFEIMSEGAVAFKPTTPIDGFEDCDKVCITNKIKEGLTGVANYISQDIAHHKGEKGDDNGVKQLLEIKKNFQDATVNNELSQVNFDKIGNGLLSFGDFFVKDVQHHVKEEDTEQLENVKEIIQNIIDNLIKLKFVIAEKKAHRDEKHREEKSKESGIDNNELNEQKEQVPKGQGEQEPNGPGEQVPKEQGEQEPNGPNKSNEPKESNELQKRGQKRRAEDKMLEDKILDDKMLADISAIFNKFNNVKYNFGYTNPKHTKKLTIY
jgi:hypothetical protein